MQRPALLVMVKNPIAGRTKTRLAADVGDAQALRMYRMLMRHTRDQALGLRDTTRYLHYSEAVDPDDEWPNGEFIKLIQVGDGLGTRMAAAFDHAFARGHDRVVIIGSDCPGVTTSILENAFDELTRHDVVIGPAKDGGYYLLGLRHPQPRLFVDMVWSTDKVYAETLSRVRERGLRVATLTPLSDVDRLEDWEAYGWPQPASD